MPYGSVLSDVVQSSVTGTPPQFNDGAGTQTGTLCRAWVYFNGGAGNTAGVINSSFNVSSITVNGTGNFTVNFTTAMPNTNYATVVGGGWGSANTGIVTKYEGSQTTTSVGLFTAYQNAGNYNIQSVNLAVFR